MPPKKASKPASKGKSSSNKPASKSEDANKADVSTNKKATADDPSVSAEKEDSKDTNKRKKREASPGISNEKLSALLNFLVNDASSQFASGKRDQPNLFDHMSASADYTPFQNLVASVVMSKPISSRLGVRTLATLFSPEVDFTTPEKLRDAGEDGRYDALSKARTQHKDKTSLQLGKLAERVLEHYSDQEGDTSLEKMRKELGGSTDGVRSIVKEFYGCGDTAADIFRRRMQADWKELYPYADERALNAAAHLGLAHADAETLRDQVASLLSEKSANQDEQRKKFTALVDALVATDLEHKYEELEEVLADGKSKKSKTA